MERMTALNATLMMLLGILMANNLLKNDPDRYLNIQLNTTYDYIVVGAGSAGAVVASRLSEDPDVSVLLLEAGGSELKYDNIRVPLYTSNAQKTEADWAYYTVPQKNAMLGLNNQQSFWPRGRALGGSSNLNYMAYVRGSKHDFNLWEKEGCTGWSYKDVLPYFLKMEDIQIPPLYDSPYHSRGGYLTVSQSIITPMAEYFRRAAKQLGYKTVDNNGEEQIGFSYMQASIRKGERCNTAKAYLRPVMDRPNLHISTNTMATKIITEKNVAKGLEIIKDNRKSIILARKEIILSGGAVNSPSLLMLSGIGPKEHLKSLGIPLVANLPVGNNLEDHTMFHVQYNINATSMISTNSLQEIIPKLQYYFFKSGIYSGSGLEGNIMDKMTNRDPKEPAYPDYQITVFSVAQDNGFIDHGFDVNFKDTVKNLFRTRAKSNELTWLCIPLHSKSRGTIRLKSKDPFEAPLIDPHYLEHPYDVKVMLAAVRKAQELMRTNLFSGLGATLVRRDFPGICDKETFDSDSYWECLIRHFMTTLYHPASTCKMGASSDPTAVVDPQLRVKGIPNLRIADASVMRTLTSGNINAPTIMIGEKVADMIRQKDTVVQFRKQIEKLNV